jgi:pimeloyl-ACP methyl ester carboxylesterase
MTDEGLIPFEVRVSDEEIADLRERLARTRWPDQIGEPWEYGSDLALVQALCEHWRDRFDWRSFEARHNQWPQFTTIVDGQRIHFIHARSPEPDARPLLITHGWPGTVTEFLDVIGPLSDPVAHGGDAADAFHVVAPSLPGYGFSGPTTDRGWDIHRSARAYADLMARLGYGRFFAQGGDWGSLITSSLGGQRADVVAGIHLTLVVAPPPPGSDMSELTPDDIAALTEMGEFTTHESGYQAIQGTKPQTLSYALTDSPSGLAAWIVEKFRTWSDCNGDPTTIFSLDRLLDNISIYWLTGTINSSMRMYYESMGPGRSTPGPPITVPVGHGRYPREIYRGPRAWAEAAYDLVHWQEMPRGGHFAAMEVPDLFVDDVRLCFSKMSLTS